MTNIVGPTRISGHPQRLVDCQVTMEHRFKRLITDAEAAGWTSGEVEHSLLELAMNHIEARKLRQGQYIGC